MVGGEHQGIVHPALLLDHFTGNQLGDASGGSDRGGVGFGEGKSLDFLTIFQLKSGAFESVGNVCGWVNDGPGDDVGGLASAPSLEAGTVVDAGSVELMTHNAAGRSGFASGGIAFELENVLDGEPGLFLTGSCYRQSHDFVGIVNAALLELCHEVIIAPFADGISEEPVCRVLLGEGIVAKRQHGVGSGAMVDEG